VKLAGLFANINQVHGFDAKTPLRTTFFCVKMWLFFWQILGSRTSVMEAPFRPCFSPCVWFSRWFQIYVYLSYSNLNVFPYLCYFTSLIRSYIYDLDTDTPFQFLPKSQF